MASGASLRLLGRGGLKTGHLNTLRMELERSPGVSLAGRGLSDSTPRGGSRTGAPP